MGADVEDDGDELGCAVALASLDHMTPTRLATLTADRSFVDAWADVLAGGHEGQGRLPIDAGLTAQVGAVLAREARSTEPEALLRAHREAGVTVAVRSSRSYPAALAEHPDAPAVIFMLGDPALADERRAAVVGTRDCTRAGRDVAYRFGADLARARVAVVSGLALGIDCAAHAGVFEVAGTPPIGVVGSGLDVVYPRRNAALWRRVGREGLLLSEHPLGVRPRPWHFLARNRIIAGLAEVVVVVESHERGGALQTAQQAEACGRTVMAVPGSIQTRACAGSNHLLTYPHTVACTSADAILAEMGVLALGAEPVVEHRRRPSAFDGEILEAIGWQPVGLEELLARTSVDLGELTLSLDRLEEDRWVGRRGAWVERVGAAGSGAPQAPASPPVR